MFQIWFIAELVLDQVWGMTQLTSKNGRVKIRPPSKPIDVDRVSNDGSKKAIEHIGQLTSQHEVVNANSLPRLVNVDIVTIG